MKTELQETLEQLRAKCLARIETVKSRVGRLSEANEVVSLYFAKRAVRKLRESTNNQLAKR